MHDEAYIYDGTSELRATEKREKTDDDDSPRGVSPDVLTWAVARSLAAKARLLERLLTGDERVLATELREELEALVGPTATIIPIGKRR